MATKTTLGNPDDNEKKKGTRKVNLNDLRGSLSKRGREPFFDAELKAALEDLLNGEGNENAFIWNDGFVNPNAKDEEQTRLKAKFRSRANSIVQQIAETTNKEFAITIQYSDAGDMVISKRGVKAQSSQIANRKTKKDRRRNPAVFFFV